MDINQILCKVDHTNLKVNATWNDIKQLCDEAIKFKTASICIPPAYVEDAVKYVDGKTTVCTVIGFPNGYNTTETKIFEIKDALKKGAKEFDIVINDGWVKDKKYDLISNELKLAKEAACGHILKVIVETCLLDYDEKVKISQVVSKSGADYIKTSTGFSEYGATFDDVKILLDNIDEGVKCKAAGGIRNLDDAEKYINMGVERLGTSAIVKEAEKMNS